LTGRASHRDSTGLYHAHAMGGPTLGCPGRARHSSRPGGWPPGRGGPATVPAPRRATARGRG